ncbi:MAG: ABC-type transport system, permease component [Haloplasmataceae bacterium]|jgi:multiple sugar transport system permease protein|nr:ABC-type transport system, permease component [Haloplasmataceae bacterium]
MTTKTNKITNLMKKEYSCVKNALDFSNPVKNKVKISKSKIFGMSVIRIVILYGLSFMIVYPLLQQISVALRQTSEINDPSVIWLPKKFSLDNIRLSIAALDYWVALRNTFVLSTLSTVSQLISCSLAGYAFARLKSKYTNILFIFVILTIVVPSSTLTLPQFIYFQKIGLLGKAYSIVLMSLFGQGIKSGIFIYIFRQFFKGIPIELDEAAQVDGAGPFQIFLRIMLPSARGAIVTVGLFAYVWQWNDGYFSSLFLRDTTKVLTTAMYSIQHGVHGHLQSLGLWELIGGDVTKNPLFLSTILNTAAILIMTPLLIMYFFVQKLFVEGVERTGIVG